MLARKPAELEETGAALEAIGARARTGVAGSAGDPAAIDAVTRACVDELGGLDILVNNAATNPSFGPMIETETWAVDKVLEVNVKGPLLLAQAAWRAWMQEHGGMIVNVVSVGGIRPAPFIGIYNVSKAALAHMTRQLALELAPTVRVNAIAPGLVKTDMAKALYEQGEEAIAARHPMKRLGVPDDIAGLALFLASDVSSWMTGEVVAVEGGMSLYRCADSGLRRVRRSVPGRTRTRQRGSGVRRLVAEPLDAGAVALGQLGVGGRGWPGPRSRRGSRRPGASPPRASRPRAGRRARRTRRRRASRRRRGRGRRCVAPSRTTDPFATRHSSPRIAPCTTQLWATVAPGPTSVVRPGGPWSTAPSWMFAPRRITTGA